MNNIGQRIKRLRKMSDLTQEQLADHLGVTHKAVSKWECGLTMPDISLIIPLARILQVSADELLGGKQEDIDKRRAEFDKHCDDYLMYDTKEDYQMALTAVNEYPTDYKYISWLAQCEMYVAYCSEYKEDPTAKYSQKMLESAIKHNNMVITECEDTKIREKAIWNTMICYKNMDRYDDALKYAKMFPTEAPLTRNRAMEHCLQGESLVEHRKQSVYLKLRDLCIAFSRIYYFAESAEPHVIAALNAEEMILNAVFPDGNYYEFHKNLCCAYQTRAIFEIRAANYDRAMQYLQRMMEHARKIPSGKICCSGGALDGLCINVMQERMLPYVINGLDDVNLPILDQLKNRLRQDIYAPLWSREDFKELLK